MTANKAFMLVMEAVMDTNQDKAVRKYKESLSSDPDFKLAHYHLGMIYAGRGLYRNAIEHYQKIATDIDSQDPGIRFILARQYHLDGQLDKAIEQYKKAYELDPLCEKACLYISQIYCDSRQNLTEALAYAEKALELRTPNSMVDEDEFLANRKRVQLLLQQVTSAEVVPKLEELEIVKSNLQNASISKLIAINPDLVNVFMKHGIRCVGCEGYGDESVLQAAGANGSDLALLLEDIRNALPN